MKKITLNPLPIKRYYKNNGQHAEMVYRYTMTGEIIYADNKPYWEQGDCNGVQVKSGKACACKGYNLTDLLRHLDRDAATGYAFVLKDFRFAVIMNRAEYTEFVCRFGYNGTDTKTGEPVTRIKADTDEMMGWFDIKLNGKTRYNTKYWYLG